MAKNRKAMVFGVTVLGVMLAVASVAFACTTFKGRFEVTAGGATSKAWGKTNLFMTHCGNNKVPISAAEVSNTGGTITVEMFPTGTSGTNCPASQLSDSSGSLEYNVYYVHDGFTDASGVWEWDADCMAGSGTQLSTADAGENDEIWIDDGRSTVSGDGDTKGSRTYTITSPGAASGTTDRAGVCISDTGAGQGNQTPIKII